VAKWGGIWESIRFIMESGWIEIFYKF